MSKPNAKQADTRYGFQEHQVFWNEWGEDACAGCDVLPYPGSDTWVFDRWEEVTPAVMAEIDREGGTVKCHYCGREPSRIVR